MIARFYAAMAEAAGRDEIVRDGGLTVASLRADVAALGPDASRVVAQCSVFREGKRLGEDDVLRDGDVVDVLPPFAGG
jgi:molybdopterin converting factor small subunit